MKNDQAATFSSCVVVSSSVTLIPFLNFTPASTSVTSSWPFALNAKMTPRSRERHPALSAQTGHGRLSESS